MKCFKKNEQENEKSEAEPHFFRLEFSSNAVLMWVSGKRDAKELKLKANHNVKHLVHDLSNDAKELKLKANHNPQCGGDAAQPDAKELKLKANHNAGCSRS